MHVAFKGRCYSHLLMAFRAGRLPERRLRDGAGRGRMLLILQEMGQERSSRDF